MKMEVDIVRGDKFRELTLGGYAHPVIVSVITLTNGKTIRTVKADYGKSMRQINNLSTINKKK
jgi:hypothetical protein